MQDSRQDLAVFREYFSFFMIYPFYPPYYTGFFAFRAWTRFRCPLFEVWVFVRVLYPGIPIIQVPFLRRIVGRSGRSLNFWGSSVDPIVGRWILTHPRVCWLTSRQPQPPTFWVRWLASRQSRPLTFRVCWLASRQSHPLTFRVRWLAPRQSRPLTFRVRWLAPRQSRPLTFRVRWLIFRQPRPPTIYNQGSLVDILSATPSYNQGSLADAWSATPSYHPGCVGWCLVSRTLLPSRVRWLIYRQPLPHTSRVRRFVTPSWVSTSHGPFSSWVPYFMDLSSWVPHLVALPSWGSTSVLHLVDHCFKGFFWLWWPYIIIFISILFLLFYGNTILWFISVPFWHLILYSIIYIYYKTTSVLSPEVCLQPKC